VGTAGETQQIKASIAAMATGRCSLDARQFELVLQPSQTTAHCGLVHCQEGCCRVLRATELKGVKNMHILK
jgi:hypothetical protein